MYSTAYSYQILIKIKFSQENLVKFYYLV